MNAKEAGATNHYVKKEGGDLNHGFEHSGNKHDFSENVESNEVSYHKNGEHQHTGNTAGMQSYLHRKVGKGVASEYGKQRDSIKD
jgi:hypothetical protein